MAFFGLTQLGPQNPFAAALLDSLDITLFSEVCAPRSIGL